MADSPVEHGTGQRAATETPEHQPEVHRATVRLIGVEGQDHGEEGQNEEVGDDPYAEHPQDEPVTADERYAFSEFDEVPASTSDLYDRVGYATLVRVGLVRYQSFRAELARLEAEGLAASTTGENGATLWRRPPAGDGPPAGA